VVGAKNHFDFSGPPTRIWTRSTAESNAKRNNLHHNRQVIPDSRMVPKSQTAFDHADFWNDGKVFGKS
jgi:hypothetical protein